GGRITVESVVRCSWNGWPDDRGIRTTLFSVIDGRYQNLMPTIVISNLKAEELPGALGERCVDRLRENGGIAVRFDWPSKRSEIRHD
ncbi:hypothetical protein QOT38_29945, partial [Pseudomonas aeruginosa]